MSNFWQPGFWATGFWQDGFWGVEAVDVVPVGICTNVSSLPGRTIYRPAKRKLFKSQWWKKKRIVVDGIEVEPLKPFETFDVAVPGATNRPAMLMRTHASKARLHRTAATAIRPAALMRSTPTFLPLIRS